MSHYRAIIKIKINLATTMPLKKKKKHFQVDFLLNFCKTYFVGLALYNKAKCKVLPQDVR